MATVSQLCAAVLAAIRAALPEVDSWSAAGYEPAITTQGVALIGTALGHQDDVRLNTLNGGIEATHRLRVQLWTRIVRGDEAAGIGTARDVGYRALRAVALADGDDYELAPDEDMTARTDDTILVVGELPFVRTVLTIPVWQAEEGS